MVEVQHAGRVGRPDDVETLLTQARGYAFGALTDRAPPLYRRAIELDPANEEAHAYLAIATWGTEQSVVIGNKSLRLFGDYHEVHNFVAHSHAILGNEELAREHYDKAMADSNLDALVFGGMFLDRLGDRELAENAWRRGIELTKPKVELYPDNQRMRLLLACFYGLLGERASMLAEEQGALENADVSDWTLLELAAVHAGLGETERTFELLRRSLRLGLVLPYWRRFLQLAAPNLESEALEAFVLEYEAEEQRLRKLY